MSLRLNDIIDGAAFRADMSVVVPSTADRVQRSEWATLAVKAVKSVWTLAAGARPDFQVASKDFVVANGGSASFALPDDAYDVIDVVFGPDTPSEYSLGPFTWANRRSPGGWFPANFGGSTNLGGNRVRLMGGNVYIEPSLRAGGTYRLWYCPKQRASGPFTVRLATPAALPACTAAGAGVGKTLTANANGAISIDSVAVVAGDRVLIKNQVVSVDNGIYTVTQPGTAGTPFIFARAIDYDETSEIAAGDVVFVSAGATLTNFLCQLATWGGTLDTGASTSNQTWTTLAVLDSVLDPFGELIEILTALPVFVREDDLDPRPLQVRAYGNDGAGGLVADLKSYFRQVRSNTVQKMIDTDLRTSTPWWQ